MTGCISVVSATTAILLPRGSQDDLVGHLRAALAAPEPFAAVISVLACTGAPDLPSFACAVSDDAAVHVLVRGAGIGRVTSYSGQATTVSAQVGVTTWREEAFESAAIVELAIGTESEACRVDMVFGPLIPPVPLVPMALHEPSRSSNGAEGLPPATPVADRVPPQAGPGSDATLIPPQDLGEVRVPLPASPGAEIGAAPRDADDFDFAHLLEETQYRGVEAAAIRDEPGIEAGDGGSGPSGVAGQFVSEPARPGLPETAIQATETPSSDRQEMISAVPTVSSPPASGSAPRALGDHDGHTVSLAAIEEVRRQLSPALHRGPRVQAVFCTEGHPNPPNAPTCRSCEGAITDRVVQEIDRPVLGYIRLSTGASIALDRSLLVGRRPTVSGVETSDLVGLVAVPDSDHSISRLHAEFRVEGWDVFVVDLRSKNGTTVQIPGQEPTKLRAGEPFLIVPGTSMTLGDVVEVRFEVARH